MSFSIPFVISTKVVKNVTYFKGMIDCEDIDCEDDENLSYIYHNKHSRPIIIEIEYDKSQDSNIKSYYFIGDYKEGLIRITSFKEYEDWQHFSQNACTLAYKESQGVPDFSKLDNTLKVGNNLTIQ